MQIPGLNLRDSLAHQLSLTDDDTIHVLHEVDVEVAIEIQTVRMGHYGSRLNYRPYLHMTGELREITPVYRLQHDINAIYYAGGRGPTANITYEYSDAQLAQMAQKNYFTEGFEPPKELVGEILNLDSQANFIVIDPKLENDVPVVFADIPSLMSLQVNENDSGYDLENPFGIDYTPELSTEVEHSRDREHERDDELVIRDLFADKELVEEQTEEREHRVVETDLDRRLRESRERFKAEQEAELNKVDPNSPEAIFEQRVASKVRDDHERYLKYRDEEKSMSESSQSNEGSLFSDDDFDNIEVESYSVKPISGEMPIERRRRLQTQAQVREAEREHEQQVQEHAPKRDRSARVDDGFTL